MNRILGAAAVAAAMACHSLAGVVIEMQSTESGSKSKPTTSRIFAQDRMLRMESEDKRGGKSVMIFRGDEMLILMVDRKQYYRIGQKEIDELSETMSSMAKQMEESLKNVPEAQRAAMEKFMKNRMPQMGEAAELKVKAGGASRSGSYACRMYEVWLGEDKMQEVCAADPSDLGAAAEAEEAFRAMAEFSSKLIGSMRQGPMSGMFQNPYVAMSKIQGLPVMSRTFEEGRAVSEVHMKSAQRQSLDGELFEAPAGYKRVDMMRR